MAETTLGGARYGPTPAQCRTCMAAAVLLVCATLAWPRLALQATHHVLFAVFLVGILFRIAALACAPRRHGPPPLLDGALPSYTVIVPLYDEAEIAADIVRNLSRLDYPRDRLQVLIALESHDVRTREAFEAQAPPWWMQLVVCPCGAPQTKPRACNEALALATGEIVVIYDAEDAPDPLQLREAAARFAVSAPELACLQAPLRVRTEALPRFERQFALEYAAQFEVMLPAYAAWALPFPLGGTSNHFRRGALEATLGWDAWNVTEDADLGMRLAAHGLRMGVLTRPTFETAPDLAAWVPQRTRWIKGYMQTWGVHTRAPWAGGWRRTCALQLTLGYAVFSAVLHGPLAALTALASGFWAAHLFGLAAAFPVAREDALLCVAGWLTSVLLMAVGARRAGSRMRWLDALLAPAYWPLQSWSAYRAIDELVRRPFHWNKTRHRTAASAAPASDQRAGDAAAVWSAAPEGA